METAPRNCRFLSLVVVELVLKLLFFDGSLQIVHVPFYTRTSPWPSNTAWLPGVGAPDLGSPEAGHPDFFRSVPTSSNLFRFAFLVFRNTPICSDFFRCVFRTHQNRSGKRLSAHPFCKALPQIPSQQAQIHFKFPTII